MSALGAGVKVLTAERGCGGGFCEKGAGAALCWNQMVPAGSKMDPLQDTDEPSPCASHLHTSGAGWICLE